MNFPARAAEIAVALWGRHPDLAVGSDDQRRLLMRCIAQQLAFELGPAYGVKSAGPGRPQGPSQIAYRAADGFLGGWRVLDGDASVTGIPQGIIAAPTWQDWPDQVFIPVDPIDHLNVGSETLPRPSTPPPAPSAAPSTLEAVLERLNRLESVLAHLERHLDAPAPVYRGQILGFRVTWHPEPS